MNPVHCFPASLLLEAGRLGKALRDRQARVGFSSLEACIAFSFLSEQILNKPDSLCLSEAARAGSAERYSLRSISGMVFILKEHKWVP